MAREILAEETIASQNRLRRRHLSTEGFTVGSRLGWTSALGFYLNGRAHITAMSSTLASEVLGRLVTMNRSIGYGFDVDAGVAVPITGGWTFSPQAGLNYRTVDFEVFEDPFGGLVAADLAQSFESGISFELRHEHSWLGGTNQSADVFLRAGISHEALTSTSVSLSGVPLQAGREKLFGQLAVGGSYQLGQDDLTLSGLLNVRTGLTDVDDNIAISVRFAVKGIF